ncbi:EXOSC5 [Bugula neritina]|uniref:EXOSC5 n=1 Tax=Bugula neritina TaxID=10212 RepID=A0A7J7JRK4_BUGNE|nr:EXOSC5 [Bugula neritina]
MLIITVNLLVEKHMLSMDNIGLETSILKQADGSGKFTLGLTSVLASVDGPAQVGLQKEIIDRAFIEVHYESKSGQSSCSSRTMEYFVAQLCQQSIVTSMHPRTSILINITELHNDGCLSACAVNATTLSLLDAGIPLRYIVSAASCCISDEGTIYVNPSKETIKTSASYYAKAIINSCAVNELKYFGAYVKVAAVSCFPVDRVLHYRILLRHSM